MSKEHDVVVFDNEKRLEDVKKSRISVSITEIEPDIQSTSPWQYVVNIFRPSKTKRAYRNQIYLALCLLLPTMVSFGFWLLYLYGALDPKLRLRPLADTGLSNITLNWHEPSDSVKLLSTWTANFSRGITPIPVHSHNDYHRRVPLFEALSTGCTGLEADIWLRNDGSGQPDLWVGHNPNFLNMTWTFQSLYIKPLLAILSHQNAHVGLGMNLSASSVPKGVFDDFPSIPITLLIDFKSNDSKLWELVNEQLEPLRQNGWLTHWNSSLSYVTTRPVTVVVSGMASFEWVVTNSTYRDIFFDAPLYDIENPQYDVTNSFYASADIKRAVGKKLSLGKFNSHQRAVIKRQIAAASKKGLKARYWGTIRWPRKWMHMTWGFLLKSGVGMLNVDDINRASRWLDWSWCAIDHASNELCHP